MLRVLTMEKAVEWDAIVRSFRLYDVYWLSGYARAFQLHGDGIPLLFYYQDDRVRGINVTMKRDVTKDDRFVNKIQSSKYFDLVTPYGYGGWIIEGDETRDLFDKYENWAQNNGIISEFVRFHPLIENQLKTADYYEIIDRGEVVHMDLCSLETIWQNITSKNRNVIRKAIKNDVKIYNGRYPDIFSKFRKIYDLTMDKDHAKEYYYFDDAFYQSILNDLPFNSQVFYAEKDGVMIAASIILCANGRMNYHLSGTLQEYSSLAASNLLLFRAAQWGSNNGYNTFYLGGGVGLRKDGLYKFKKSFYRGGSNHFYTGTKIFNKGVYRNLVEIRKEIDLELDPHFFPLYRA